MLLPMKDLLAAAKKGHFGIPAPGAGNEHALRACIDAAEEKRSPLIILVNFYANPDICFYGRIATDMARRASVPISIIQDHGGQYEHAIWAIRAGFTDVMVDRSSLPYEENAAQVKELVKIAHAVGVGVEAELGHVGNGSNYEVDGKTGLTVPDEAVRFVEETGVDSLAVAIGTAHGVYKGTPKLHFDLLEELNEKIPVPLVLHGGSGSGNENISKACKMGICKVNLANDLYRSAIRALQESDMSGNGAYGMYPTLAKGYREKALEFIDVCGAANTAHLVVPGGAAGRGEERIVNEAEM